MKTIFWNVDTQYDFMRDDKSFKGALAVPGARGIEKNLERLTKFARKNKYQIVNTGDWHTHDSKEFSENPDFINTFPPHCLQNTKGSEFVPATNPKDPYVVGWNDKGENLSSCKAKNAKELILYKDVFDIFDISKGNKYSEKILKILDPDRVIVYGVATNYCVNYAVKGLVQAGKQVYVVEDAIKEIPTGDLEKLFDNWKWHGIKLTKTGEVLEALEW